MKKYLTMLAAAAFAVSGAALTGCDTGDTYEEPAYQPAPTQPAAPAHDPTEPLGETTPPPPPPDQDLNGRLNNNDLNEEAAPPPPPDNM